MIRWLGSITVSMNMNLRKLGDGEGQGSLVCCSPWGHEDSDTTERLDDSNTLLALDLRPDLWSLESCT